ncbi:hypothetical protein IC607_06055 [Cellulomonas sp. JH27-2]|uniref:hypothetical protein n=1 Tax=Cellulomonas sp. JH27-2 TaxID=2774139 RepID=UPI001786DE0C|nr:hypothetical protein [Cellulomonas sp. JH27-2]MBD8058526.1 hypothetical protein [Cellulomonas sp. JH27-2]
MCGLGGNDTINGGNGDDVIDGGAGNDTIAGGMVAAAALVAKKLEAPELGRGAANTLSQRVGTAPTMDPAAIGRIAAVVAVSTTLYRESQVSSDAERRDRVTRAVRACSQTAVLLILPDRGAAHPCRLTRSSFRGRPTPAAQRAMTLRPSLQTRASCCSSTRLLPSGSLSSRPH